MLFTIHIVLMCVSAIVDSFSFGGRVSFFLFSNFFLFDENVIYCSPCLIHLCFCSPTTITCDRMIQTIILALANFQLYSILTHERIEMNVN